MGQINGSRYVSGPTLFVRNWATFYADGFTLAAVERAVLETAARGPTRGKGALFDLFGPGALA